MTWSENIGLRAHRVAIWNWVENPRRRHVTASIAPVHYQSAGAWQPVDYAARVLSASRLGGLAATASSWFMGMQDRAATSDQLEPGTLGLGDDAALRLRLARVGWYDPTSGYRDALGVPNYDPLNIVTTPQTYPFGVGPARTLASKWDWNGIWQNRNTGIDVRMQFSEWGWYSVVIVRQAVRNFLVGNGAEAFIAFLYELDADGVRFWLNGTELQNSWQADGEVRIEHRALARTMGFLRPATSFVPGRGGSVQIRKRIVTIGTQRYLALLMPRSEVADLLNGDWHIDPPISQESIQADTDDCYDRTSDNTNNTAGYNNRWYLGQYGTDNLGTGLRFITIPVDPGSTIDSAAIRQFRIALTGTPNVVISADDVDDAGTWTAGAGTNRPQGSGYTPTTATVTWNTGFGAGNNEYVQGPDLAAIVQEIVDRAGWASNNDIRFRYLDQAGASNFMACSDYTGANNAATLDIDAETAGGKTPYQPQYHRAPVVAQ